MIKLNDRINSSVVEEKDSNKSVIINSSKLQKGGRKKTKSYPLAKVPEIEQELTSILQKIATSYNRPNFIIVFDELDKIEVPSSQDLSNNQELIPEFENVMNGFPGGETSRKRKHNLLNLLANMKYFISTAKAQFIFISGRELYDASLADVADREFAISSIFSGVIYVNSFLTSNNHPIEISEMTERYICKRLIPKTFLELRHCEINNRKYSPQKLKRNPISNRELEEMLNLSLIHI